VYKRVRIRWRKGPDEAQEIAQEFFLRSVENGTFRAYEPGRAPFRAFLRVCLDRCVVDLARRALTQKRSPGTIPCSLDIETLEGEIRRDGADVSDPDRLFEEEWLRSLVAIAIDSFRAACDEKGKQEHFRVFERWYSGSRGEASYPAIAADFNLSVSNVMNRLTYARREFRAIVLETLRELTSSEQELRTEARIVLGIEL